MTITLKKKKPTKKSKTLNKFKKNGGKIKKASTIRVKHTKNKTVKTLINQLILSIKIFDS